MLTWNKSEPKPDPFEAAAGDVILHEVHHSKSSSISDLDIDNDVLEVVQKALTFSSTLSGPRAKKMLILWDVVYCSLILVYTDETMMLDSSQVTKCSFESLGARMWEVSKNDKAEWKCKAEELSCKLKDMLAKILRISDLSVLPAGMSIHFSDENRSSVGGNRFVASKLFP